MTTLNACRCTSSCVVAQRASGSFLEAASGLKVFNKMSEVTALQLLFLLAHPPPQGVLCGAADLPGERAQPPGTSEGTLNELNGFLDNRDIQGRFQDCFRA